MKYLVCLLLIISSSSYAENIWKEAKGIVAPSAVTHLAIDTKNTVYAASFGNLYRSLDGGDSWSLITIDNSIVFSETIRGLKCDKEDNLVIFNNFGISILKPNSDTSVVSFWSTNISEIIAITIDNEIICTTETGSIYKSNESRTNWSEINLTKESNPGGETKSIHYDDEYGIIKVYSIQASYYDEDDINTAYYTTDFGKTWLLMKYLPNSNITFRDIKVIDSKHWLYLPEGQESNWTLWDITNGKSQDIDEEKTDLLFNVISHNNNIYLVNYTTLHISSDNGLTWTDFSLNVFENFNVRFTDAFAIDSLNNYYLGTRYHRIMKYSDKNGTWTNLEIDLETNVDIRNGFKYVDNILYATDNWQYIYHSKDNGKNWDRIPYPRVTYSDDFDINTKGEIIIADGRKLQYSSDFGKNWVEVDSTIAYNFGYIGGRVEVHIFEDGSIYSSGGQSYFLEDINTKSSSSTIGITNAKRLSDGTHFGLRSGRVVIANSDFSDYEFIDNTIKDIFGGIMKANSYAVSKDGSVYLATSKGLLVAPGFIDDWKFVDFPQGLYSVSIDDNDYIYLRFFDEYENKDSVIYSKDNAETWHPIYKQTIGSTMSSFLGFGDGNLVLKDHKVRYAKVPTEESLTLKSKIEQEVWDETNGVINFTVSTLDGVLLESAAVIIYKSWVNGYDTLTTNSDGIARLEVPSGLFNSNVDTSHEFYFWTTKEGFQTSKIYTQILEYNSQVEERKLFHINSNNKYHICKPDSTIDYDMSISDSKDNIIKGKFKVENFLINKTEEFENVSEDFATYSFKIPSDTPLGMYKLSFQGVTVVGNRTTSLFETYLIVTDTIYKNITIGVNEDLTHNGFKFYPNPVNDFLNITTSDSPVQIQTIKIVDINGITVKELLINSYMKDIEIKTIDLPSGMYIVMINKEDGIVSQPIIIE